MRKQPLSAFLDVLRQKRKLVEMSLDMLSLITVLLVDDVVTKSDNDLVDLLLSHFKVLVLSGE